jgi:hypothetical protein
MKTSTIQFGFAALVTLALAGCGANYTVSGHAESAAFARPRCNIVVEPIHADHLVVDGKSESAYVAGFKKAQTMDSYDSDKVASEQKFREALMAKHGSVFTGRPTSRLSVEAKSNKDYATGSRMRQALNAAGDGLGEYIDQNWQCAR